MDPMSILQTYALKFITRTQDDRDKAFESLVATTLTALRTRIWDPKEVEGVMAMQRMHAQAARRALDTYNSETIRTPGFDYNEEVG
ncbi:MAG: hypothetical protein ABI612_11260 [Betaproteobacteria bacterium]